MKLYELQLENTDELTAKQAQRIKLFISRELDNSSRGHLLRLTIFSCSDVDWKEVAKAIFTYFPETQVTGI